MLCFSNELPYEPLYSETCLNRTSLGPAIVSGIDRCLVHTGLINKDFLHWNFIFKAQLIQDFVFWFSL